MIEWSINIKRVISIYNLVIYNLLTYNSRLFIHDNSREKVYSLNCNL